MAISREEGTRDVHLKPRGPREKSSAKLNEKRHFRLSTPGDVVRKSS